MSEYPDLIYHMAHQADWQAAAASGLYHGSADDKRDGFIHFSSLAQIRKSAAKHRHGQRDLILIQVSAARLGPALRWEINVPGGQPYPHLYASLDPRLARQTWPLPWDEAQGQHDFPDDLEG